MLVMGAAAVVLVASRATISALDDELAPDPPSASSTLPRADHDGGELIILNVHVPGASCYEIGDEIWQQPLQEAISAEADTIADYAGPELLPSPSQAQRAALRDRIAEMTSQLTQVGDVYTAPDGVVYSLTDEPALDPSLSEGTLSPVSDPMPSPVVQEVLRFEDLPLGSAATRRAIARWSDGSESVALSWYGDEILSPVDHLGRQ